MHLLNGLLGSYFKHVFNNFSRPDMRITWSSNNDGY
ncbi:uncharacterized protein METZ01_LOCUS171073 [marine metagenome]|uniref:Uncharacterized protein n=1 Tax=marine metagenome TaxID=408172 RepID=A0A382BX77_9ZZZZ